MRRAALPILLLACDGSADDVPVDTDAQGPRLDCPDLSSPGLHTTTVEGVERTFQLWYPQGRATEGMPLVFVWHGLTTAAAPGEVAQVMSEALRLRAWAREAGVIVVVPEAQGQDLFGQQLLLWGIASRDNAAPDLALFDHLAGCGVQELGADPERVGSFGFSGGGLWTSVLLAERAEAFAAVASASGGTGQGFRFLDYETPDAPVPVLLTDGGAADVWPGGGLAIIDFQEGTADLREHLVEDGHVVTHCEHTWGHIVDSEHWAEAQAWLLAHTRGAPSPYASGEASLASSSCGLWVDGAPAR